MVVCVCSFAQLFLAPYGPMNCSPPGGSSVHEILQGRILVLLQVIFLTQGSNLRLLHLVHWASGFFTTSAIWESPLREVHIPKAVKRENICY